MKGRVLLADDALFMREMIREIIEPDGFEVTQVVVGIGADGEERVELSLHPGRIWADGIPVTLSGQ